MCLMLLKWLDLELLQCLKKCLSLIIYRFTRVTFGLSPLPFLLVSKRISRACCKTCHGPYQNSLVYSPTERLYIIGYWKRKTTTTTTTTNILSNKHNFNKQLKTLKSKNSKFSPSKLFDIKYKLSHKQYDSKCSWEWMEMLLLHSRIKKKLFL